MNNLRNRAVKAASLALVLAVTHFGLGSELARAATSRLVARVAPQSAAQGRLTTRGNNPVTVGGNPARSGETIFSGQSVQTPAGVGATVNLPGLGRVDIAPNSNATLSFGDGKINVNIVSGCAVLTADRGTAGTLEAGGSTQHTEGAEGGVLDVCNNPGAPPVVGQGAAAAAGAGAGGGAAAATTTAAAASGGLFGLGTAGTVGFVTAAGVITAAAIIAPCRRGANPSPGTPRGRNDECRD
jgi:hypothetical protein